MPPQPATVAVSQEEALAVENYFRGALIEEDAALLQAVQDSRAGGLPVIEVTAALGKLLHLLARSVGARRILEVGTLGGYSTIWLGRALPADGHLVTLELDPHHAHVARTNLMRAGLDDLVEIKVGPALDTLPTLAGQEPFDLVFIDADKPNNPAYLEWAVRLARVGALIVVDNVVRRGMVADPGTTDPSAQGVRAMVDLMAAHEHLDATVIQTVGQKGWDGIAVAVVTSHPTTA